MSGRLPIISKLERFFRVHDAKTTPEKVQLGLIVFMQLVLLGGIIFSFYEKAWVVSFVGVAAMFAIWLPSFLAKRYDVRVPLEFEFVLTAFIYSAIFLGIVRDYYDRFPWWDVMLHTLSGIALGFVGFLILYTLYRGGRMDASPFLIAVFSFMFALALGAVWEMVEFSIDSAFGTDMQKSGLRDTMWDLIVDALGALVAAVSGYLYVRRRKKGIGILQYYLSVFFEKNAFSEERSKPPQA